MNAPKKPVQPWIPPRAPLQPQPVVTRVVRREATSPNGVIKAGWRLCVGGGLLVGVLASVAVALNRTQGEGIGVLVGFGGYYVALVLYSGGGLAHTVLSILAIVRGAVGRGLMLMLVGPLVALLCAAGPPLAMAWVKEKGRIVIKEEPPEVVRTDAETLSSRLCEGILGKARKAAGEVKNLIVLQSAQEDARLNSENPKILDKDRHELLAEVEKLFAAARAALLR